MRKALLCASALALALIAALGGNAQAQSTGLDALHDKVRVGGRVCMADHFHDGSGSGRTRAAAQRAAIAAWVDFTAWEYGNRWGSFGAAVSKSMSCSGGGGSFSCSVSARPCRY